MKFFFLLLVTFAFSCLTFSQLQLKVPLKSIITDVTNEFQSYKGRLKSAHDNDSNFYSNVIVEGSKENEIAIISDRLMQYHAYIADSANKKQAKSLVEKWKERISTAAPDFTMAKIESTKGNRKTVGYRFSKLLKPICNISIVYSKREIDDYYWVLLTVTRQGKGEVTNHPRTEE